MAAHSKVGASSTKRWMTCPGSVVLSEGIESKSSDFAAEGTLAHELADNLLNGKPAMFPAGDMNMAVMVYVDYVKSLGGVLATEQRFHLKELHDSLFGTSDAVVWQPDTKTLHVVDYKHGQGVAVEIEGNTQLRYYAVGALLHSGYPANNIVMTIVQPRCPHPDGPIRSETISAIDLLDWSADLVDAVNRTEEAEQARKTMSDEVFADTYLEAGDHCRWCPAAALCPKLHQRSQAIAKLEFGPVKTYDPARLSETLLWLPILEGWIKSVREFAYAEAEHGRTPPGWKLVEKRATRKWKNDDDALKFAKGMVKLGVLTDEEAFVTKLATVAQLEKALGKGQIPEELVSKESSGYTLAPEEDKRSAVKSLASDVFANA